VDAHQALVAEVARLLRERPEAVEVIDVAPDAGDRVEDARRLGLLA
jgi:hypothetical protein